MASVWDWAGNGTVSSFLPPGFLDYLRSSIPASDRGQSPSVVRTEAKGSASSAAKCVGTHQGVGGRPPYCGKSLQNLITIMTVEPTATATGQINGNSSTRPTMAARTRIVLFDCVKRKPATPIGYLCLAPSSSGADTKRENWARLRVLVFPKARWRNPLVVGTLPGRIVRSDCCGHYKPHDFDWTSRTPGSFMWSEATLG